MKTNFRDYNDGYVHAYAAYATDAIDATDVRNEVWPPTRVLQHDPRRVQRAF